MQPCPPCGLKKLKSNERPRTHALHIGPGCNPATMCSPEPLSPGQGQGERDREDGQAEDRRRGNESVGSLKWVPLRPCKLSWQTWVFVGGSLGLSFGPRRFGSPSAVLPTPWSSLGHDPPTPSLLGILACYLGRSCYCFAKGVAPGPSRPMDRGLRAVWSSPLSICCGVCRAEPSLALMMPGMVPSLLLHLLMGVRGS